MLDLFDHILLRRPPPRDDSRLEFRRIDGNSKSKVIYFLPFHTPFRIALYAGFIPLDFLACYEMPPAIVSSDPCRSLEAMHALVANAEALLLEQKLVGWEMLVVGLSAGTFPATYLANRIGARLCSVASVDRADLAVWHSVATRPIKSRAVQKGFRLSHYSDVLNGSHPAQNLAGIGPSSVFVMGGRDPYIPPSCKAGLLHAIETYAVNPQVIQLDAGHFRTLRESAKYQRGMIGARQSAGDLQSLLSTYRRITFATQDCGASHPYGGGLNQHTSLA